MYQLGDRVMFRDWAYGYGFGTICKIHLEIDRQILKLQTLNFVGRSIHANRDFLTVPSKRILKTIWRKDESFK